ncbi:MAG: transposase, partial [Methylocystis sp.]
MKEDFQRFWELKAPWRIASFFLDWTERAKRTRIETMRKLARTLDRHGELIFNWFEARGEISAAAVEGMNLKVKLTTRRFLRISRPKHHQIRSLSQSRQLTVS